MIGSPEIHLLSFFDMQVSLFTSTPLIYSLQFSLRLSGQKKKRVLLPRRTLQQKSRFLLVLRGRETQRPEMTKTQTSRLRCELLPFGKWTIPYPWGKVNYFLVKSVKASPGTHPPSTPERPTPAPLPVLIRRFRPPPHKWSFWKPKTPPCHRALPPICRLPDG